MGLDWKENHNTYGGHICFSDFYTNGNLLHSSRSEYADRIISDWKFDNQCKNNILKREQERKKKEKNNE